MKLEEVKRICKVIEVENMIKISWRITKWCNYHCEYCYMAHALEDNLSPSQEEVEKVAGGIKALMLKMKRPVHLQFIGGEPCAYNLLSILKIVNNEYLASVIIVSNFSRSYNYYSEIVSYCLQNNIAIKYNASFHIEEMDKRGVIEDFMDKVLALKKWTSVKAMVNYENKEWYRPYLDKLFFNHVTVLCGTVRDADNRCIEDPEILDFVRRYNQDNIKPYAVVEDIYGNWHRYMSSTQIMEDIEGGFMPTGFKCTAGLDCLRVDTDGKLTRAGCRMGKHCNLGNVLTKYTLPAEPIICTSDRYCSLCYFTNITRIEND